MYLPCAVTGRGEEPAHWDQSLKCMLTLGLNSEEVQGTYNFICESNKIIDSLSTKGFNCVFSQPNLKEERSSKPWPPVYLVHTGIFRHVLAECPSLGHGIPATLHHPGLFFFFWILQLLWKWRKGLTEKLVIHSQNKWGP